MQNIFCAWDRSVSVEAQVVWTTCEPAPRSSGTWDSPSDHFKRLASLRLGGPTLTKTNISQNVKSRAYGIGRQRTRSAKNDHRDPLAGAVGLWRSALSSSLNINVCKSISILLNTRIKYFAKKPLNSRRKINLLKHAGAIRYSGFVRSPT